MTLSTNTIDRIVANVLSQLSPDASDAAVVPVEKTLPTKPVQQSVVLKTASQTSLTETVITADLLEKMTTGQVVAVSQKAIITPAANDLIRERRLVLGRTNQTAKSKTQSTSDTNSILSIAIVHYTAEVQQAIAELGEFNKELLSCPDDAAKYAISELCRTGANDVFIFAEQTHRAACLTNRNSKAKAVVVQDSGDVKIVRKQLRANVWCIDPSGRSYFELKNLIKTIRS
jgi:hypothetical protein